MKKAKQLIEKANLLLKGWQIPSEDIKGYRTFEAVIIDGDMFSCIGLAFYHHGVGFWINESQEKCALLNEVCLYRERIKDKHPSWIESNRRKLKPYERYSLIVIKKYLQFINWVQL